MDYRVTLRGKSTFLVLSELFYKQFGMTRLIEINGSSREGVTSCSAELKSEALFEVRLGLGWVFGNLRVSASAASSPAGLVLLLLEDLAPDSSETISATCWVGDVVLAIDELNSDPEGAAVILAATTTGTSWEGHDWRPSRHDVCGGQTAWLGNSSSGNWNVWHVEAIGTALTRGWNTLSVIWVQAEEVVWHGGLIPEVHENCVVVRVGAGSVD